MSKLDKINLAWEDIQWQLVQKNVFRYQHRIYKASKVGNVKVVQYIQRKLINSIDGRLLATQRVTTFNKGKNTAGVDKIRSLTSPEKIKLCNNLRMDGKAKPIRRVFIPKPGKAEKRPLGIPTIRDRAKQALATLALEPEWEAKFEPNSYGFRPGRCAHDAIEAIFLNLRHGNRKYIFDADIRKCFDSINHKALLEKINTYPELRDQVLAWLEAGIMEGYSNTPKPEITYSNIGTPQGGIISPLLANIALHGLENDLKEYVTSLNLKPTPTSNRGRSAKAKALSVIRYADDFLLIHSNKEILIKCINYTETWLETVGLEIHEGKSSIKDSRQGVQFLGHQIIHIKHKGKYKTKISPSKEKCKALLEKISLLIKSNRSISSYRLISILRPIIIGWANYYRYSECTDIFTKLTHKIFLKTRAWVFRRDTRSGRNSIKEKYFPSCRTYSFKGKNHKDNWILVGKEKNKNGEIETRFLPHMSWVPSEKYTKVKSEKSPFDGDIIYWTLRTDKYSPLSTRVRNLLRKQKGICPYCKIKFKTNDRMEVDHGIPRIKGGKDVYSNLQLLHLSCHVQKTAKDRSSRNKVKKIAGAG
jgi:RNA-directed DNA polymerase